MCYRVQHQNRHGAVNEAQRMPRCVEKENVGQTQHQTGHRHGQHGHQMRGVAHPDKAPCFFHHKCTCEHHQCAHHSRPCGQTQGVEVSAPAFAVEIVKLVIGPSQAQVVGPTRDQRSPHRHAQNHQQHASHQRAKQPKCPISRRVAYRHQGHRTAVEQGHLPALYPAIGRKSQHGRQEQDKSDHRTH